MDVLIRRQCPLFIDRDFSQEIDQVRKQFNPQQQALIDSHVTLCRDRETADIPNLVRKLRQLRFSKFIIKPGRPIRFDSGRGVLLPAIGNNEEFHLLRSKNLKHLPLPFNRPQPHITLMHPRNAKCTDEIFI